MAMRETVRTLRLYFGLSGGYAIFSAIRALSLAGVTVGLIGLSFGMVYLYLCVRLPSLLKDSLATIKWVLVAASVFVGMAFLSGLLLDNVFLVGTCVVGFLVNWYLYRNSKRLAAELQNLSVSAQVPGT